MNNKNSNIKFETEYPTDNNINSISKLDFVETVLKDSIVARRILLRQEII